MTKLTDDDIRHLARLARIRVNDDDVATFRDQLSGILDYVTQLETVDTEGLAPTSQVSGLTNVTRADDDTSDTMARDRLLDQVPAKEKGHIKVRRVL